MPARAKELETFKKHLPELAGNEGKFALVADDKIIGTFDSYADALASGYEKMGLKPFLVKQISSVESISFFSRDLACPT